MLCYQDFFSKVKTTTGWKERRKEEKTIEDWGDGQKIREATRKRVGTKHMVGGDRLQAVVLVWVVVTGCLPHPNEQRHTSTSCVCLFYF